MVRFWDPTYRYFTFNEVDMVLTIMEYSTLLHYDFRDPLRIYWKDAMGKASGDRQLALFLFAVYGLIVFPKALGYVSVELADFLFQIEKGVNPAPTVLAETILLFVQMKSHFRCLYKCFHHVFVPPTRPIEEFLKKWVLNLSTLTYEEIEWRAPWMILSTVLIGCNGHLWVPLISIWGAISYTSLMVLSQYGYDQCVPATTSLNRVETSDQDSGFWKKLEEIRIKWGQTLSLQLGTFFNHFLSEMYI
ncbi:hypothetical protein V6Z12_A07G222300 [Gossypium hirsutum]